MQKHTLADALPDNECTRRLAREVSGRMDGKLFAVSDLHVTCTENREFVAKLRPESPEDWLLVAGDVAEKSDDIEWAPGTLRSRFAAVIWSPGNHELWTLRSDPVQLRGAERYRYLVGRCRNLGVLTPEDPYPVWRGAGGPALIVPLFLLYDYTFLPSGATSKEEGLAAAYESGAVCSDEAVLHPDPYASREAWCHDRVAITLRRLALSTLGCRPFWSAISHSSESPPGCCTIRNSPSGAAPNEPPTGTCGSAPWPSSTGICTSTARPGTTGCGLRRSRSVTRRNWSTTRTGHAASSRYSRPGRSARKPDTNVRKLTTKDRWPAHRGPATVWRGRVR